MPLVRELRREDRIIVTVAGAVVAEIVLDKVGANRARLVLFLPPSTQVRHEAAPSPVEGPPVRCPA